MSPPVEAAAVQELATSLPADPRVLESFARDHVRFDNPWVLYGVPWYFPTVSQVLDDRAGDCQAIAVLTASLFEAKGLPYTLRYSFDHVWVDYPGKQVTRLEDPATAFVSDSGRGWLASLPGRIPLNSIIRERVAFHWTPMPLPRKAGLLGALLALAVAAEAPGLLRSLKRSSSEKGPAPGRRTAEADRVEVGA